MGCSLTGLSGPSPSGTMAPGLIIGVSRPRWVLPSLVKPTRLQAIGIHFVLLVFTCCGPKTESPTRKQTEAPESKRQEAIRVRPGSTVVVLDQAKNKEFTYRLVYKFVFQKDGSLGNQATIESPVGKALLGKQVGDLVRVQGPGGPERQLKILRLTTSKLDPPPVEPEVVKEALELLDYTGESNDYSTTITGRIRNNSSKKYSYAQVTFNLYDAQSNRVGSALANISGLEAGETWKFKAVGLSSSKRFTLDTISGF